MSTDDVLAAIEAKLPRQGNGFQNGVSVRRFRDAVRDDQTVSIPASLDEGIRIDYVRVNARALDLGRDVTGPVR
jgi:hypothetical protein